MLKKEANVDRNWRG